MSMGNFIRSRSVCVPVMAATNPSTPVPAESDGSGVGMAHPTVVPTNFDPADDGDSTSNSDSDD